MSDQGKVDIVISTKAELAGAQQALNALEKQILKAKALNREYAALEQAAKKVQSAIAAGQKRIADGVASSSEADIRRKLSAAWDADVAAKTRNSGAAEQSKLKALWDADVAGNRQSWLEQQAIQKAAWDAKLARDAQQRKVIQQQGLDNLGVGVGTLANNVNWNQSQPSVGVFGRIKGMAASTWAGVGGAVLAVTGAYHAVSGAARAASAAVHEYARAQQESAKLDAALASRGQMTDGYRQKLHSLAEELQKSTGINNDNWIGALTKLTQFGANDSNIDKYTAAVKNLAGILGGDVEQAAFIFGKALQGNFTILQRYGIAVDENATLTKKLEQAMSQIALRGTGQLEAANKGVAGSLNTLHNAFEDIIKTIGGSDGFKMSVELAANAMDWWADWLKRDIEQVDDLETSAGASADAVEQLAKAEEKAGKAAKQWADMEKHVNDQLNQRKDQIGQSEQADIDYAKVIADQKRAGIEGIRAKGFATSDELTGMYQGGLITKQQYVMAMRMRGRGVGMDALLNQADTTIGVQERGAIQQIKEKSNAQRVKAQSDAQSAVFRKRDELISGLETQEERLLAAQLIERVQAKLTDLKTKNTRSKSTMDKLKSMTEGTFMGASIKGFKLGPDDQLLLDQASNVYNATSTLIPKEEATLKGLQEKYPGIQAPAAEQAKLTGIKSKLTEANTSAAENANELDKLSRNLTTQNKVLSQLNSELNLLDAMRLQNKNVEGLVNEIKAVNQKIANLRNK